MLNSSSNSEALIASTNLGELASDCRAGSLIPPQSTDRALIGGVSDPALQLPVATAASSWLAAFAVRSVWLRAAKITVPVGLLQIGINQGDYWLRGAVTPVVLAKTVLTPCVTYAVALFAAASTYRQLHLRPPQS
jgi:hypothetical protein